MFRESIAPIKRFLFGDENSTDYRTPHRAEIEQLIDRPTLAGWLPYSAYLEETQMFANNECLGFVIEVVPQTGADEEMAQILKSLYSALPTGAGIQFHCFASPDIRSLLTQYCVLRQTDKNAERRGTLRGRAGRNRNPYRLLAREAFGFYSIAARGGWLKRVGMPLRTFRVIVSVSVPGNPENYGQVESVLLLREGMRSTLKAAGLPGRDWNVNDLLNWVAALTNPQRLYGNALPIEYDPSKDLRAQIVDSDTRYVTGQAGIVASKPDGCTMEMRMLSVKTFPVSFSLWQAGGLIGDLYQAALQYPCPFLITLGVHVLDPETSKQHAYIKGARATTNAESYMAKLLPEFREKKIDWDIALKALDNGEQLVSLYHQLALFAPPEEMARAEQAARAIWRSRGFELANDVYVQQQALLASLPLSLTPSFHDDLKRLQRVSTKTSGNAVHLAPLITEWKGTKTPICILAGKRHELMFIDVFDNDRGNANAVIAGASRSGKSFFLNDMAQSYASIDAKVWVIEVGRSFKNNVMNSGGTHIEFDERSDLCLNPFTTVVDINDDLAILLPLLATMASPREPLDEVQYKSLGRAIQQVWDAHSNAATVSHVAKLLATGRLDPDDLPDQRLQDIATMLYPFTADGQYHRWFEGAANVDFSADFTVLELEELKNKKDLQQVVLLIVMYRITQEMYLSRTRKKVIMVDEAWDLFSGESSAKFIEEGYRRIAKYQGSFIAATQGIDDYYKNASGMAAVQNSDWMILFRQKKESIEQLAKSGRLALDDATKRMISSLKTEHGVYAELFISSPMGQGLARFYPDHVKSLLYSSKADDFNAIAAYVAKGMAEPHAIKAVLADRGIELEDWEDEPDDCEIVDSDDMENEGAVER
ncbi:MAG: type IV secretion system protein TraC [Pseudomonadota bacterium]